MILISVDLPAPFSAQHQGWFNGQHRQADIAVGNHAVAALVMVLQSDAVMGWGKWLKLMGHG